ncbi:hypothetical protein ALC57_17367 [Trachymyrmex cornetzi]|uniref:Uncharacterized protein n=1 Tax=Trachymyrmex cornetzi TaxID=471704 RepID=A0A195DCX5_9HYME|nr:hypothetical protein ALC57_17367 [Trachymyrmex cornetzi]
MQDPQQHINSVKLVEKVHEIETRVPIVFLLDGTIVIPKRAEKIRWYDAINDRAGEVAMPDVDLSREPSTPSCLYEVLMAILPSQRRCPRPHRWYLCLRIQSHVDSREARVSSA